MCALEGVDLIVDAIIDGDLSISNSRQWEVTEEVLSNNEQLR